VSERVNEIFRDHDVLLTPVTAELPGRADRWHDKGAIATFLGMTPYITYTAVWNYAGLPAASVPAGFTKDGLPLAVQLVGRPNDEATLISLAAQLERARPWHQRPANR
jgi:amidase